MWSKEKPYINIGAQRKLNDEDWLRSHVKFEVIFLTSVPSLNVLLTQNKLHIYGVVGVYSEWTE